MAKSFTRIDYYFDKLDSLDKRVYMLVLKSLLDREESVKIPHIRRNRFEAIYQAISYDHPEIYYIDFSNVRYEIAGVGMTIFYTYVFLKQDFQHTDKLFSERISLISEKVKNVKKARGDYWAEILLHDYFVTYVYYDKQSLVETGRNPLSFSAYGALTSNKAVCEGIAKATKLILDTCNIQTMICYGKGLTGNDGTSEDHAWNIVRIQDHLYHLDITWDLKEKSEDDSDNLRYDYLNLDEESIRTDHFNMSINAPCNDMTFNYHMQNGLYINNRSDLVRILEKQVSKGESFSFRIKYTHHKENIPAIVAREFSNAVKVKGIHGKRYEMYSNPQQLVFGVKVSQEE